MPQRLRLGASLVGALDQREWEAMTAHLAACRECLAERGLVEPVVALLRIVDADSL